MVYEIDCDYLCAKIIQIMTLTYIFHSGFVLEAEKCVLIFDYWMDPANVVRAILKKGKSVYVFSSHFHEDHFTKKIFSWKEYSENITYILSKDILRRRRARQEEADVWMGKGATWQDANIQVVAMGSNDSGVSWIVEVDGKKVFHSGDLNNWYAKFLYDRENIPQKIISDEFGEIDPLKEEKMFLGELKDIAKYTDEFDIVMFPVDGRIGNGYTLGARQFIERFKVGLFVPMHFVMSGFESAWRMKDECEACGIRYWSISNEGESIEC